MTRFYLFCILILFCVFILLCIDLCSQYHYFWKGCKDFHQKTKGCESVGRTRDVPLPLPAALTPISLQPSHRWSSASTTEAS